MMEQLTLNLLFKSLEVASSASQSVSMNHNYFCLIYQKLLIRVCDRQIFSPERLFVML